MLYGENIKVPGEIFSKSQTKDLPDPLDFVSKLRNHFETVRSNEVKTFKTKIYIPKDLTDCTHVFVRIDKVKRPLSAP